jgi:SAM-dependent methyltransferase
MTCRAVCPVCGASELENCGPPRHHLPTRVAGVPIQIDDLKLSHLKCRSCTYRFVFPQIPYQRLIECYTAAKAQHWTTDQSVGERRSYDLKRRLLEKHAPGRRVLDFGCYDGGFLEYLGENWHRSGIEPSTRAAERAKARGIRILASSIEEVAPEHHGQFDAIVVFDVMEHLNDPVAVLRSLSRLLTPGGIMLLETGNSDSAHWRLAGTAYWYCAPVEHVGFFNKRSIQFASRAAGLIPLGFDRSVHSTDGSNSTVRFARGLFYISAYYALRAVRGIGVPLWARAERVVSATQPATLEPRDHFLAVLRRPT